MMASLGPTEAPCLTCYSPHNIFKYLKSYITLQTCTVQYILYTIYITLKFTPQFIQLLNILQTLLNQACTEPGVHF